MANFSTPTLTITAAPTPGQSVVAVGYEIQFDAFDRASDQPYLESVALIGDDTGVPGDPASAAPDDQLGTIVNGNVVRASMSAGKPTLARNVVKTVPTATLNEDRAPFPDPDEIRALVTLTPKAPVGVARESNLVSLTDPTDLSTTVPDLRELLLDRAISECAAAGLVAVARGSSVRGAWVQTQSPSAGTVVARGSTVTLTMHAPPLP